MTKPTTPADVVALARKRAQATFKAAEPQEHSTGRTLGPRDYAALRELVGEQPDPDTLTAFATAWREEWDYLVFDEWEEEEEDKRLDQAGGCNCPGRDDCRGCPDPCDDDDGNDPGLPPGQREVWQ